MNKFFASLIALAAISGAGFAGNDGSNGQSSRDIASTVIYSDAASTGTVLNRAGTVDLGATPFSTTVGDREAGASSH